MKRLSFIMAMIVAGLLLLSCGERQEEEAATTVSPQDVMREAREAAKTGQQYAVQKKQEYVKEMRKELNQMQEKMNELEQDLKVLQAGIRMDLQRKMDELEKKMNSLGDKLDKMSRAGEEKWQNLKSELEIAFKNTRTTFNAFQENLQTKLENAGMVTREKRDQFRDQMEKQLDKLEDQMNEIGAWTEKTTQQAKAEMSQHLKGWKNQSQELRNDLDEMKNKSGKAWQDLKQGMEESFHRLKKSVDEACAEFKK